MLYDVMESGTSEPFTSSSSNEQQNKLYGDSQKFAIERQTVNEASFRCPDDVGWQPQTSCSLDAIVQFLKKRDYDVVISDDAGRFVCNYFYYHSL